MRDDDGVAGGNRQQQQRQQEDDGEVSVQSSGENNDREGTVEGDRRKTKLELPVADTIAGTHPLCAPHSASPPSLATAVFPTAPAPTNRT